MKKPRLFSWAITQPSRPQAPREAGQAGDARPSRLDALRRATSGIGRRAARIDLERAMFLIGCVCFPLGLLVIFLGWYGAAHTPYLFEQVPYLISGGLIGLGLVLVGGFLYFGDWLARVGRQQKESSERALAVLSRLETVMTLLATGSGGSNAALARADLGALNNGGGRVLSGAATTLVATARGTMVHRADCSIVLNKQGLRPVELGAPGLTPCKICEPAVSA